MTESSCCQEDGDMCGPFHDQQIEIDRLTADNARLRASLKGIAEFCSGDDRTLSAIGRLASIRNTALLVLAIGDEQKATEVVTTQILDPGHSYLAEGVGGAESQRITFVKNRGDKYPGNKGEPHGGILCQELMRILIAMSCAGTATESAASSRKKGDPLPLK